MNKKSYLVLNENEILLLEDFSDYNRFPKFHPVIDWLHVNERFSIIIDHRNNTSSSTVLHLQVLIERFSYPSSRNIKLSFVIPIFFKNWGGGKWLSFLQFCPLVKVSEHLTKLFFYMWGGYKSKLRSEIKI